MSLVSDLALTRSARDASRLACGAGRLRAAAVVMWDEDAADLVVLGSHGASSDVMAGVFDGRLGRCVVAEAVARGELVRLSCSRLIAVPCDVAMAPLLLVAILEESSSPDLKETLEAAASLASAAVVARLDAAEADRRQAARARTQLAREIHEQVVQRLFGVSLALGDDPGLDPQMHTACAREVEHALGDLRQILRTTVEDDVPEPASTLWQEVTSLEAEGAAVELDERLLDVPPRCEPVVMSVVAEALRNARKHARPQFVRVRVRWDDDVLRVAVTNDGALDDPAARHEPGVGLRIAVNEAAQHGGLLEYGPGGRDRWSVRLVLPLEEEHDVSEFRCTGRRVVRRPALVGAHS